MPAATIPGRLDRRHFLRLSAASGAGLLIGCSPTVETIRFFGDAAPEETFTNAWLHVNRDGEILFFVPGSEMGQGIQTTLTAIVADELDADWPNVRTVFAPYNPAFDHPQYFVQVTGGSSSVSSQWEKLRRLGATARAMMVQAAADRWQAEPAVLRTRDSVVHHPDGRSFAYGELAGDAARLSPPGDPPLKSADQFRLIGRPVARLDTDAKISGGAIYGIDVRLPGMLHATVAQSPVFGGMVKSVDLDAARSRPGVLAVVPVDNGIAVVADSHWHAVKGLEAASVIFDPGPNAAQSSAKIEAALKASMAAMPERTFDGAAQRLDLEYQVPYLAHQPLEPMNCTAHVTAQECRIWAPTQNQHAAAVVAARVTGLPRDAVKVTTTHLGGGFGRRLEADFVKQAVTIAKAVGQPVQLVWSREEDMQHDFYRPISRVRFQVALGPDGLPTHWYTRLASPSSFQRYLDQNLPEISWLPVESLVGDVNMGAGLSTSFTESNPFPYAVGDLEVDREIMDFGVPTGSHRSVQHSLSGFCKEAAIDECAMAAGQDPLAYRRKLLADQPRYLGVMDLAAKASGWGAPPAGRVQGLAVHRSFNTWVAQVVELSVGAGDQLKIHRIVCAVDCGRVVNPRIAESQVHGAALWGLEGALFGEITIEEGRVAQSNFHDYRVLHLAEAPPVEVHFVPSTEAPSGLGEPGTPPVAAALTNAIYRATGKRIRTLPIVSHGFDI